MSLTLIYWGPTMCLVLCILTKRWCQSAPEPGIFPPQNRPLFPQGWGSGWLSPVVLVIVALPRDPSHVTESWLPSQPLLPLFQWNLCPPFVPDLLWQIFWNHWLPVCWASHCYLPAPKQLALLPPIIWPYAPLSDWSPPSRPSALVCEQLTHFQWGMSRFSGWSLSWLLWPHPSFWGLRAHSEELGTAFISKIRTIMNDKSRHKDFLQDLIQISLWKWLNPQSTLYLLLLRHTTISVIFKHIYTLHI